MNLRKTLFRITLGFGTLLLASCSDDGGVPEPVEIIVSSTGLGSASGVETHDAKTRNAKTRNVSGSVTAEGIIKGSPLDVSMVRIDQSGLPDGSYLPYTAVNTDHGTGQAPRAASLSGYNGALRMAFRSIEFFLGGEDYNNTKLIGWYPPIGQGADDSGNAASTWTVADVGGTPTATVGFTIDGKTDVLVSNLVAGNKDNIYNTPTNTLVFDHLLTRFRVRVFATSDDVADAWGTVQSIALKGKAQTCAVTLPGVDADTNTRPGAITFTGSNDLPIIYSTPGTPVTIPVTSGTAGDDGFITGTTLVGEAMVAPEDTKITLGVVCGNKSGTLDITAPQGGFKPGSSYTLTLEFTERTLVLFGVSINDWVREEEENDTVS